MYSFTFSCTIYIPLRIADHCVNNISLDSVHCHICSYHNINKSTVPHPKICNYEASSLLLLLLSLALQPSLGHGLLHKIQLNFLEASQQFSFLQGRVVSPTPNHHPGGPDLCIIYIPQRQGGYPF
jgi:hypothetical protein